MSVCEPGQHSERHMEADLTSGIRNTDLLQFNNMLHTIALSLYIYTFLVSDNNNNHVTFSCLFVKVFY